MRYPETIEEARREIIELEATAERYNGALTQREDMILGQLRQDVMRCEVRGLPWK